jgi:thiamine biosynthesis lipoprotein
MGTLLDVRLEARSEAEGRAILDACFARVAELEAILTTFDPASAVSRMNASAGRGPFAVPAEVGRIVRDAQRFTALTDGVFDVSVGPLIDLWEEASRRGALPAAARLEEARARVGAARIAVAEDDRSVTLAAGMSVNFGGFGKGWALDRVRELLDARGVENAYLDFGGSSLLALGRPRDAADWRVAIPDGRGGVAGVLALRDESASISESFGHFSVIEGRRYGHVIDPRSGWPVDGHALALAVTRDGAAAEALTKALLVLPAAEGLALVASRAEAEALVIEASGAWRATPGLEERFEAAETPR